MHKCECQAVGRKQRAVPVPCVGGQPWGSVSIRKRWAELWQQGLGLMCHFSSVCFHFFGRNQFLPWLYLLPRKLLYCLLSCRVYLLYGALGWSVINFSPLGFWFKVFSYCLCFAHGCGIIDLHGLELWAEVSPGSIYQLLLLKQPGCPHLILSVFTVAFPEVLLFFFEVLNWITLCLRKYALFLYL